MGACSAFGCPNRSEHGFVLKAFPRDPQRRAIWAARVNRKNWEPKNGSRLCEMHFAPCMWEVDREDGKRKLKIDAVPTLFSFRHVKKNIKLPVLRKCSKTSPRMVHFEPCMWEVDQVSGKRKLKADAVPSLTMFKRLKLPTPVSPRKSLADHSYIKSGKDAENSSGMLFNLMSEIYVLETPTSANATKQQEAGGKMAQFDDVTSNTASETVSEVHVSGWKSDTVTPKLRTYFNNRKTRGSTQCEIVTTNNVYCVNSSACEKAASKCKTNGSTPSECGSVPNERCKVLRVNTRSMLRNLEQNQDSQEING